MQVQKISLDIYSRRFSSLGADCQSDQLILKNWRTYSERI